jgi:hypothetical protein
MLKQSSNRADKLISALCNNQMLGFIEIMVGVFTNEYVIVVLGLFSSHEALKHTRYEICLMFYIKNKRASQISLCNI